MDLEVRLFGGLVERVGRNRLRVEIADGATVADLRRHLTDHYPALAAALPRTQVAVDLEVAGDDQALSPDAEVALLPPVAGGGRDVVVRADGRRVLTGLTSPPFDLDDAVAAVTAPEVGAAVTFLGTVRDHAPDLDHPVVRLDYSAYPEMADKVLADIAQQLLADHPRVTGIVLLHAVGELAVGDHTILVACVSAHRDEAFAACREALEQVKARTPIWKREVGPDGTGRWVGLAPSDASDNHPE